MSTFTALKICARADKDKLAPSTDQIKQGYIEHAAMAKDAYATGRGVEILHWPQFQALVAS
jgi:hypothetical protein